MILTIRVANEKKEKKGYISLAEKEANRKKREKNKRKKVKEISLQIQNEEDPKKKKKLQQKLTKMTKKPKSVSVWALSGGAPGLGKRKS